MLFQLLLSLFLYSSLQASGYKMISPSHWKYLQFRVVSNETTPSMKEKINHILFQRHVPFVYGMTYRFRQKHYQKSKNIKKEDMIAYAYKGLYDAVQNYNGRYSFVNFAKCHVNGALYKSLTDHNQISVLSKRQRQQKVENKNHEYFDLRRNVYLQKRDYLKSETSTDDHLEMYYKYMDKWNEIDQFPPFVKRCFYLKFNFHFDRIRSNKDIAELMCCKEEWVRRNIANYIQLLSVSRYNNEIQYSESIPNRGKPEMDSISLGI